ncbi:MAG: C69 family dipeptidase [Solobacterium sp.]|nr:C69 family dipeptidase [Solobacterium sp.]
MKISERACCSTILVGKNASKTGKVIVAHNEDDFVCAVQSHVVPHRTHEEGEFLRFDDGTALVPQVPETLGYYWSEQRCPGGEPFADAYINECGVAVVSNKGFETYFPATDEDHQGLGYGVRQIVAERAHTAREGVEVIKYLMDNFGYRSERIYEIADKDEAWAVQVTHGRNFAARRIGDDEVYYMPNWLTIHEIDFSDTEHKKFYWSDTVVTDAIAMGRYTPAKEGDYSDFDFAEAYQKFNVMIPFNMFRSNYAWTYLVGEKMPYKTFSAKAPRKYGLEEMKEALRLTVLGTEEDKAITEDWKGYGTGHEWTVESTIILFDDDPKLTVAYRAFPMPARAPFVPWYAGITRIPEGYEWIGWEASQASHFHVDMSEFKKHDNVAYRTFLDLAVAMGESEEFKEKAEKDIAAFEARIAKYTPFIENAYRELAKTDPDAAVEFLTEFTAQQAKLAWDLAKDELDTQNWDKYSALLNSWLPRLW